MAPGAGAAPGGGDPRPRRQAVSPLPHGNWGGEGSGRGELGSRQRAVWAPHRGPRDGVGDQLAAHRPVLEAGSGRNDRAVRPCPASLPHAARGAFSRTDASNTGDRHRVEMGETARPKGRPFGLRMGTLRLRKKSPSPELAGCLHIGATLRGRLPAQVPPGDRAHTCSGSRPSNVPICPGLWGNGCEMKVWPGSAWFPERRRDREATEPSAQHIPEPRPGLGAAGGDPLGCLRGCFLHTQV